MHMVKCPKCKHSLRFKREVTNAKIKCRYCGNMFTGSTTYVKEDKEEAPPAENGPVSVQPAAEADQAPPQPVPVQPPAQADAPPREPVPVAPPAEADQAPPQPVPVQPPAQTDAPPREPVPVQPPAEADQASAQPVPVPIPPHAHHPRPVPVSSPAPAAPSSEPVPVFPLGAEESAAGAAPYEGQPAPAQERKKRGRRKEKRDPDDEAEERKRRFQLMRRKQRRFNRMIVIISMVVSVLAIGAIIIFIFTRPPRPGIEETEDNTGSGKKEGEGGESPYINPPSAPGGAAPGTGAGMVPGTGVTPPTGGPQHPTPPGAPPPSANIEEPPGARNVRVIQFRKLSSQLGATNEYVGYFRNVSPNNLRHAWVEVFLNDGSRETTKKFEFIPTDMDCPFSITLPEGLTVVEQIAGSEVLQSSYFCFKLDPTKKEVTEEKLILSGESPECAFDLKNVKILCDIFTEEGNQVGSGKGSFYLADDPYTLKAGEKQLFRVEFDLSGTPYDQETALNFTNVVRMVGTR